jgi:hypothetical protein
VAERSQLIFVSASHAADKRFEVDGADAASRFLLANDYPKSKAEIVWDAIALHGRRPASSRPIQCPLSAKTGFPRSTKPAADFCQVDSIETTVIDITLAVCEHRCWLFAYIIPTKSGALSKELRSAREDDGNGQV